MINGQTIENFTASNLMISEYYTFFKPSSRIRLSANRNITDKLVHSKREILFDFRTRYANGVLFYESFYLLNNPGNAIFELFLSVQNGQFKVLIISDQQQQELIIGHGFNRDYLHHVRMYTNLELGFFNIRINSTHNSKYYKSLYFNSTIMKHQYDKQTNYHLILGGHSFPSAVDSALFFTRQFIGCIGNFNIISRSSANNFDTLSSSHLEFTDVVEGCEDKCKKNLCSRRATCINFHDTKKCNCFGTELEDWHCRSYNYTVMTFRGYSSISYKIYTFIDKYYSDDNKISFHLKTSHNGLLFLALSEVLKSYMIINIKNGFLNLLFDLGNNPKNYIFNNYKLTDNEWHNVTVWHTNRKINVYFDMILKQVITLDDPNPFFYFDPEIFIGGLPSNLNISQLNLPLYLPNKKYVGCLKHVYFNRFNILYDLNRNFKMAKYYSVLPLELGCHQTESIPITFQAKSFFRMEFNQTKTFSLRFKFRPFTNKFRISKGIFQTKNHETKKWSLLIRNEDVKLEIDVDDATHNQLGWTLSNDNSLNLTLWNDINLFFKNDGFIEMIVNEIIVKGRYDSSVDFFLGELYFGSIDNKMKFVGCAKDIYIDENYLEPRTLSEHSAIFGKITLDNCQLVNPCNKPKACEHDGLCMSSFYNGTYSCDCSNTGYIGKTCHFSLYRKSCEEIHLMDKQSSGIYLIDIDRNGPLPPAHVICDIVNEQNGTTVQTIIEHNIQHQVIVREKGKQGSYYMDVFYRDFNQEMLRLLVQRSSRCRQYLRYECNNVPLSLSTYTLLYSIKPKHKLIKLDSSKSKGCQCAGGVGVENRCVDPSKDCNCDANDLPGWKHDEGYLTEKDDVAITKMFFLQFPNTSWDSEAHLYLGNLSCRDFNTQKYEITFKTKESYLEVQGWNGKEMAISFKTTANKAVIFYQSHLDTTSTYFKAVIISENQIRFEYCFRNRKSIVTVSSSLCLNCGQWQHILIERDENQMRVSINQNFKILYLQENDNFIDFDGKLYVGGAPLRYLQGLEITLGFIGCLKGLVFDNNVIDLHKYLNIFRYPNIESGCRPYCKPNLCQNQGICIELWGSYQCKCANPIAHSGRNCEVNINTNAITLKASTSLRKELSSNEVKTILKEDLIMSFRTHKNFALLLYAHDVYKNFIQIHIANGSNVVLTYNFYQKIISHRIKVGSILTNGHPVQIKIVRHQNNTLFIVNKHSLTIPYAVKLMKEHSTNGSTTTISIDNNDQLIIFKTIEKNELFIGGIESDELFNSMPGFIGCIQGLMIGGQLLDLKKMAIEIQMGNTNKKNLVKPGCKMLCDDMPCNNGGICTEDWQHESTICDCDYTSYRGETCNVDIGAHFQKNSSVVYFLDNKIMDFNHIDISLAFSSSNPEGSTILMMQYANSTRFLHIALLSSGKLFVEEDNGHEIYSKIIENEEDHFFDSYRHWIRYTRKNKSVQIIVDSIIFVIDEHFKEFQKTLPSSNENIIIIGSNKINNQNFSSLSNFRGCISNINIILDDLKINPLESAFGIRSGLSDVKVNGPLKQGICTSFKIQQKTNVPMMRIDQPLTLLNKEIWFNRPKPSLVPYKMKNIEDEGKSYMNKSNIVIIVSVIYLCLVLICVSIYLWKIEKRYRLLKFQGETPFFHKNQMKIEKNYRM